jgi:hypothetical protein
VGVRRGIDPRDDVEPKSGRRLVDHQPAGFDAVLARVQRIAVDGDALQIQPLAMQDQRRGRADLAPHMAARRDQRRVGVEREDQRDLVDQVSGRGVL